MLIILLTSAIAAILLWPVAKWIELHAKKAANKVLLEHARQR